MGIYSKHDSGKHLELNINVCFTPLDSFTGNTYVLFTSYVKERVLKLLLEQFKTKRTSDEFMVDANSAKTVRSHQLMQDRERDLFEKSSYFDLMSVSNGLRTLSL